MQRAWILMPVLSLTLMSCASLTGSGEGVRAPDAPPAARLQCPPPEAFRDVGNWKVMAGLLGLALIECEERRALAMQAFDGQRAAIRGAAP